MAELETMENEFVNDSYKFISLDDLMVYEDNPRNIHAVNQRDEIHKMIKESNPDTNYKQLANLVESIIIYGQSPLDNIGVILDEELGKYVTVEGNRRVTALKLFTNPTLADEFPKVKKSFMELRKKYEVSSPPKTLRCVVFPSFDDAKYWIDLKHTGQNNGAGVRDWKRIQKERFGVKSLGQIPSPAFSLFEYINSNEYFDYQLSDQIEQINNTTTLERIISDPESRRRLFLEKKNDTFFSFNEEKTAQLMSLLIDDLANSKLPVSKVYDKNKRDEYIDQLYQRAGIESIPSSQQESLKEPDPSSLKLGDDYDENSDEFGDEKKSSVHGHDDVPVENQPAYSGDQPKNRGYNPENRKKLKTRADRKPPINHPKPAELYDELIKLDCRRNSVVVGICLRSYIEYTCKTFLTVICSKGPGKNEKISAMLNRSLETLRSRTVDPIVRKQIDGVIFDASGENSEIAILNSYVHHEGHIPLLSDLFTIWDNLSPVIFALWNEISEKEKKKKSKH